MSFALDIATFSAVLAGVFFFLAGTVGLLRRRDRQAQHDGRQHHLERR